MASLLDRLRSTPTESRYTMSDLAQWYAVNGVGGFMSTGPNMTMAGSSAEQIAADFQGIVGSVHQRNGIVAAAVAARALLLSQTRFVFRGTRANPDPGKITGSRDLAILEQPAGGITRPQLIMRAEQHASYAGNAYFVRLGDGIRLLRPDWVTVVLESDTTPEDPAFAYDARVKGYGYKPGGYASKHKAQGFLPDQVAHWAPEPDPVAVFRGESWIHSVVREIQTDGQALDHRSKFFEHAATPQMVFSMDPNLTADQVKEFAAVFSEQKAGLANAYKNVFVGGGADVQVVGTNFQQLDFNNTQGRDETRIALRSRVPAVILGIKESLQGSSLNAGNYAQTRRLWADTWFTPTVQGMCAALDKLITKPGRTNDIELWYDTAQVLFLQEDAADRANIQSLKASTIRQLVDGGFEPVSVVGAVENDDFDSLKHTGNLSVQLMPPGQGGTEDD